MNRLEHLIIDHRQDLSKRSKCNSNSPLTVWARKVKERDGKCSQCGTENDLQAHHVKPKSSHPELSLDINNGITLCYRCHKAEHEKTRGTRMRSSKPNRGTLLKVIAELKEENDMLKHRIKFLVSRFPL